MTSAEREARAKAYAEWMPDQGSDVPIREETWIAAWDAARGATVAEIVEWLRDGPAPGLIRSRSVADAIEARFSPAAPEEGGSAAVPSEPRRWTIWRFQHASGAWLAWSCVEAVGDDGPSWNFTPRAVERFEVAPVDEVADLRGSRVEEVGPVSEAEVEAGARALCKFVFGRWNGLNEATKDDARNRARAVLSAAREVKSDGD